jgi:hypothetical protein
MTIGQFAWYVAAHPAPPRDVFRRRGRVFGYPACCIEFFAASAQLAGEWAEWVDAYTSLQPSPRVVRWIRCPACLGVPFKTRLVVRRRAAPRPRSYRRSVEWMRRVRAAEAAAAEQLDFWPRPWVRPSRFTQRDMADTYLSPATLRNHRGPRPLLTVGD